MIFEAMGESVDISFDCVGFDKTMSTALNATRAGGKVCLVGLGQTQMTIPLVAAASRFFHLHFTSHTHTHTHREIDDMNV